MPRVHVVIPTYNVESFIAHAITSVLEQTYTQYRIIVVDDCSKDATWSIVQTLAQKHPDVISAYQNIYNRGIPYTRNKLLEHALSDAQYIAILDGDDAMHHDRLKEQVAFLEANQNIGIVGSWVTCINETGEEQGIRKYATTHQSIVKQLLVRNPIAQPSVMLRKKAIEKIGSYDETLARAQDLDYWARAILQDIHIANIPKPLTYYRVSDRLFDRSNTHLWHSFRVRLRYLFTPRFLSIRALLTTSTYFFTIGVPTPIRAYLGKAMFRN